MAIADPESRPRDLPGGVRSVLARVGRRVRRAGLLRGLGVALGVLGATFALGMAVDYLAPLPDAARWLAWAAWVGLGLGALARDALPAWVGRPRAADLAAVAESAHPEAAERLTSAVALLDRREGEGRDSSDLVAALVKEAEALTGRIDPARSVPLAGAARRFAVGLAIAAAAAAPVLIRPDPFRALAERWLLPWRSIEPIGRYVVAVEPGDARAAVGDDVPIRAEARPRLPGWLAGPAPGAAWVELRGPNGAARRVPLRGEGPSGGDARRFGGVLRAPEESVTYRVATRAGRSREHALTTVERPAVARLVARVEPPAYTGRPARVVENALSVTAWEGSRVTWIAESNRPMVRARLRWPGRAEPVPMEAGPDGTRWAATVEAGASGAYGIELTDENHFTSGNVDSGSVEVRPDRPPTLAVGGSDESVEARPDDALVVDVAARDDVAVAAASIAYRVIRPGGGEGAAEASVGTPLVGLGTATAVGEASLDLRETGAGAGDVVEYAVVVADNRPAPRGPNVTRSAPRRVRIQADTEPLLARQSRERREGLRQRLEAIRRDAARGQQEASQLRYAADAALRGNGSWAEESSRRLADRAAAAARVVDDLESLARDLAEAGAFAALEQPAAEVADVEAASARDALEAAARAADAEGRLAALRQADARAGAVVPRMDDLLRRFDELARRDDDLQRLRALAGRQEALARRAERAARDGAAPSAVEPIRQEQDALRREVEEIARRSPELKAEWLEDQARRAEALAEEAEALADRQRRAERDTAEAAADRANRDTRARAQDELATAARRLALDVDVVLEENGRGRVDVGAVKRPVEPLEQGQVEAALPQLEQAEAGLRRLARDLDELPGDARARARRLARRQEQIQQQAAAAARDVAGTPEAERPDAARAALAPLAAAQRGLARAAAALAGETPPDRRAQAEEAARAATAAVDELEAGRHESAPGRLNEARGAFERLAEALPDASQSRQRARQALQEARGRLEGLIGEAERHARETQPPGASQGDPTAPARDLARRVEPLAAQAREVRAKLGEVAADPETDAARDRAAARVAGLERVLDAVKGLAPTESEARRAATNASGWRVLGPFAFGAAPLFDVGGPIDVEAVHIGTDGQAATWTDAPTGGAGEVDLRALLGEGRSRNAAAFGVAEVVSPTAGRARLRLASDDTLTVWVNGRQVYDYGGMRAFNGGDGREAVEVELEEGPNRVVVRCGNGEGEWKFAVAVEPPIARELAERLARVERLRQALPLIAGDARVAFDRVNEALDDRLPADRRAVELAAELARMTAGAALPADPGAAPELRRLATTLRGLNLPEAPAQRAEAARRLDRAAAALESSDRPEAERGAALRAAAESAGTLAQALSGRADAAARGSALARAQATLAEAAEAGRPATAVEQRQVIEELARLAAEPAAGSDAAARALEDAAAALERAHRETEAPPAMSGAERADPPAARRAATALARLAEALAPGGDAGESHAADTPPASEPRGDDPTLNLPATAGAAARALAGRQRELIDRIRGELAARAAPQRDLRQATAEVGRRMAGLRDEVRETQLSGRAQGPAHAAADLLQQQAPRSMEQGIDQLAQGRLQAARDQQRQATDQLANAARQARDLAAALRADVSAEASAEGSGRADDGAPAPTRPSLADARAAQQRAAGQLAPGPRADAPADAAGASASMRRAAEGLRAAARSASRSAETLARQLAEAGGEPGDPSGATNPTPESGPGRAVEASSDPLDPAALARDGRRWGELPGHLRTEILQQSARGYREDYARLIQLYFREIAGAGPDGGAAPPPPGR
jgi:hypothetical protein